MKIVPVNKLRRRINQVSTCKDQTDNMIKVKVFGSTPPCAKCKEVEKRANRVADKYPGQVEVSKLDAISDEGQKYNVFFTPTVVINDKVVAAGEIVSEGELEKAVQKEMEVQP